MFCLLLGILFFPIYLPFLLLRFVIKLILGLVLLPFVLLMVVFGLLMAVTFAFLTPLVPLAVVALVLVALTRHSRAASAIPN